MKNDIKPEMVKNALRIIAAGLVRMRQTDFGATVHSETTAGISYHATVTTCTCPGWAWAGRCKHMVAVRLANWAIGTAKSLGELIDSPENWDYIIRSLNLGNAPQNQNDLDVLASKAIAYVKATRDRCPYCGASLEYRHNFFIHRESVFAEKVYGAAKICSQGCEYAQETERRAAEVVTA